MKIGYFFSPRSHSVLVVVDFENWIERVQEAGFPESPALVRNATTPELVAYDERGDSFPAWVYGDYDELLEDEEKSGANRDFLNSLLRMVVPIPDRSPEPTKSMQRGTI
jgi:hypothetical protein